jgi:hypothetical protein
MLVELMSTPYGRLVNSAISLTALALLSLLREEIQLSWGVLLARLLSIFLLPYCTLARSPDRQVRACEAIGSVNRPNRSDYPPHTPSNLPADSLMLCTEH